MGRVIRQRPDPDSGFPLFSMGYRAENAAEVRLEIMGDRNIHYLDALAGSNSRTVRAAMRRATKDLP